MNNKKRRCPVCGAILDDDFKIWAETAFGEILEITGLKCIRCPYVNARTCRVWPK